MGKIFSQKADIPDPKPPPPPPPLAPTRETATALDNAKKKKKLVDNSQTIIGGRKYSEDTEIKRNTLLGN